MEEILNPAANPVRRAVILFVIVTLLALPAGGNTIKTASQTVARNAAALSEQVKAQVTQAFANVPLSFEANRGQTDGQVQFLTHIADGTVLFTATGLVIGHGQNAEVLRLEFAGGSAQPTITGEDQLAGTTNYFMGNNPANWHTSIPTFSKVAYTNLYPGINLVYYGNHRQLEHDFVVAPGTDPAAIRMVISGSQAPVIQNGNLLLKTTFGQTVFHQPVIYQELAGQRQSVTGGYIVHADQSIGFQIGSYDPAAPLIIDPVLTYSTYLGGTGTDDAQDIAVDSSGNAYVVGSTTSTNFPTQSPFQAANGGGQDAFVTKLNAAGSALVYSTYLGGTGTDDARRMTVDSSGNAYVVGSTTSTNFPTQSPFQAANGGGQDAFVTKLNAAGTALVYSTYLGGSGTDSVHGVAVDSSGNAYVAGLTFSTNFPTQSPFQAANGGGEDAFMAKFNPAGSALVYSTYLGGSGNDAVNGIAIDTTGNAYTTGFTTSTNFPTQSPFQAANGGGVEDAFVTKLNAAGSALVYSTYLGGSDDDVGRRIVVDSSNNAYVTGSAASTNFPTQSPFQAANGGARDAFITKFNPAGSALVYSTYLGGSGDDIAHGLSVDSSGNAYLAGYTASTNFPTQSAIQAANGGGNDLFVTKFNPAGSALVYSTYLGGSGSDGPQAHISVGIDSSGNAYVSGTTASTNFPTQSPFQAANAGGDDVAIAKISTPPGTLQFSAAAYSVAESAGQVTITVNRTSGSDGTVTVNYATSNGTATAGTNYTATSGTLSFANGDSSKTISVPILDDNAVTGNLTFTLTLSSPTGGASLGSTTTTTVTITESGSSPSPSASSSSTPTPTLTVLPKTGAPTTETTGQTLVLVALLGLGLVVGLVQLTRVTRRKADQADG